MRILIIYIEFTPYINGLVNEAKRLSRNLIDVVYVGRNISQKWSEVEFKDHLLSPRVIKAVFELWRSINPDRYYLVHLAGWSHPVIFAAWLICWLRGIPFTVESDTPIRTEVPGWRTFIKRLLYPILFRLPAMFLPGGSRQAAYFRDYGVTDDKIRIAQMTVDVDAIMTYRKSINDDRRHLIRQELGLLPGAVVFLYVGRVIPHKGIRILLEAFDALQSYAEKKCALVIVGDGELINDVKVLMSDTPSLFVTGRLAGAALLDAYAAADVFVLPSYKEPWGLVVNEAMASGLPVIVTDAVGSSDDLVEKGKNGLIVPVGQSVALADAMYYLVQNNNIRKNMGAASIQKIMPWTLTNEADRMVRCWHEVMH